VELKVSRPIQVLVLVLLVAGVGGIASMSMLGKTGTAAAPPPSVAQVRARAHHTTTTPPVVKIKHPPAAVKTTPRKPAVAPLPKNGLPVVLNEELRVHRIVVVSVFDPEDKTDAISYAEARAGASDAGAGFLGVSVLDDSVAAPLTAALPGGGLLPVPGILIYRRPGVLVERVDGFQDRDGVAQLAAGAVTAPAVTATTATTTTAAPAAPAPVATPPTDTTSTTP
jgi:hypothetical protein